MWRCIEFVMFPITWVWHLMFPTITSFEGIELPIALRSFDGKTTFVATYNPSNMMYSFGYLRNGEDYVGGVNCMDGLVENLSRLRRSGYVAVDKNSIDFIWGIFPTAEEYDNPFEIDIVDGRVIKNGVDITKLTESEILSLRSCLYGDLRHFVV